MKMLCDVTIQNLEHAGIVHSKSRAAYTILSIGIKGKENAAFLQISTMRNIKGTFYKIYGNVEKVFLKFINLGRFTVRFKQPKHDVYIDSGKPEEAKLFLKMIKKYHEKADYIGPMRFLKTPKKKQLEKPRHVLNVTSLEQYRTGVFDPSIQDLLVRSLGVNSYRKEIFNLKFLTTLDMSNNKIVIVPKELGLLNQLQLISLSNNRIQDVPQELLENLKDSLVHFDLSNNLIEYLPHSISNMTKLFTLILSNNRLRCLPAFIGRVTSIRNLYMEDNNLKFLPWSFLNFNLTNMSIDRNSYITEMILLNDKLTGTVQTLKELCAIKLLRKFPQKVYTPNEVPLTLSKYMKSYKRCLCNNPTFDTNIMMLCPYNIRNLQGRDKVVHLSSVHDQLVSILVAFCSKKCFNRYQHL